MGIFAKLFQWLDNWFRKVFGGTSLPAPTPTQPATPDAPGPVNPASGHGLWVWWASDIYVEWMDYFKTQNCSLCYLKVFDSLSGDKLWKQAGLIPELVKRGIAVYGWSYDFTTDPKTQKVMYPDKEQVLISINKCIDMGMSGFVFDFETELESNSERIAKAVELIKYVKANTKKKIPIGFAPLGAPDLHPGYPYKELAEVCDEMHPQEYYCMWRGEPTQLVAADMKYFTEKLGIKIPIRPIFSCENGAPHQASLEKHQEMLNLYPTASMYRAENDSLSFSLDYGKTPFVPKPQPKPPPSELPHPAINATLANFYSSPSGYDKVYNNVMTWFEFGTTNGCAAFCSSALRLIGVPVPHAYIDGDPVSRVTLPLAKWLMQQGWITITDASKIEPGDVCFSEEDPNKPEDKGYPAHVYVFIEWVEKTGLAKVCDNKGFMHTRNITNRTPNTPFHWAMRAPK